MEPREDKLTEIQIDRIVGPTHHFGGLGIGNVASHASKGQVSNPAAAALQGLDKMRMVAQFGVPQMILPPQLRPDLSFLRSLGFSGSDGSVLNQALDQSPDVLSAAASCSAMWTANAATATPGIDSDTDTATITVANLDASLHRAIEPMETACDLRQLSLPKCKIQDPIPGGTAMRDEGAANHMRLCASDGSGKGINIFAYGDGDPAPSIRWPRQTRQLSEAIARRHGLPDENTFFLKQHPRAIDAGAFHNDVVALSHRNILIHHELAFFGADETFQQIEQRYRQITGEDLIRVQILDSVLSIKDAVKCYLFNSQIVSISHDPRQPIIICPIDVWRNDVATSLVNSWREHRVFGEAHYVDLGQSMSGGGGPACLRLRIPIPDSHISELQIGRWNERVDADLRALIEDDFPRSLSLENLADEQFCAHALRVTERIQTLLRA